MKQPATMPPFSLTATVYLAAGLVSNLVQDLPAGTSYFPGVVLVAMSRAEIQMRQGVPIKTHGDQNHRT